MKVGTLTLSRKEQDRVEVIRQVIDGQIKQAEAGKQLGVSTRQVRNMAHAYRLRGAAGLIHGNRGRESNRKIRDKIRRSAMSLVREKYWDFSPPLAHDWFEGRASKCTLIVFIDDATSRLLEMRFFPSETTKAYMDCLKRYLAFYGRPVSFYSDKHSVFRVNQEDAESGEQLTQFGRALKTLDIEAIHANTPQATPQGGLSLV